VWNMGTVRSRCGNAGPVVSSSLIGQVSLRVDDSPVAVFDDDATGPFLMVGVDAVVDP
jgi:hypothetical protein